MDYEIDSLDRKILRHMQMDSRKPFLEIARDLKVSGGTIHGRVKKMKEIGVLQGTKVVIDPEKLDYKLSAFVGIQVNDASQSHEVAMALKAIPEVLEVHYTTGDYSLFTRIIVTETRELFAILSQKIQQIKSVQSTQTLIILNTIFERDLLI